MSKYKAWADKIQMFRFHEKFHLGLGDIRLARGDGDDLMRDLMEADTLLAERDSLHALLDDEVKAHVKAREENVRLRDESIRRGDQVVELKAENKRLQWALEPFVQAFERAKLKASWASSYLNNDAWAAARQALRGDSQ